jgi:hypothetical protein
LQNQRNQQIKEEEVEAVDQTLVKPQELNQPFTRQLKALKTKSYFLALFLPFLKPKLSSLQKVLKISSILQMFKLRAS